MATCLLLLTVFATSSEDSLVALWANELFRYEVFYQINLSPLISFLRSSPVRAPRAILSYDPIDTHLPKANLAEKAGKFSNQTETL